MPTTTVIIDNEGVPRYRGQFADDQHAFAEDALKAALGGSPVVQAETPQRG